MSKEPHVVLDKLGAWLIALVGFPVAIYGGVQIFGWVYGWVH